ncbi:nuclease domain-containing protein [Acinetobacter guillouiae]|uniref:nuclease domain-containing protein n=1 Tax=Acinetobacter guillouiae TaxID=106649 RepID=UPI003AF5D7E2
MRSVSEIYEIWCFLQLRRILVEELAFIEIRSHKEFIINGFLERQLKDGMAGAFEFSRSDGVKVKLVHEPIFKENSSNIRSYVVNQKPDILLEVGFPNGKKCVWIFDAKYRIKTQKDRFVSDQGNGVDCVPDDAINQMHRYRDALIQINNGLIESKSRPVLGAFALYPGYFDQESDSNPYTSAINEVGIGAFALLPSNQIRFGHQWLSEYLCKHIGILNETPCSIASLNTIYLNEATRIPFHGMEQSLFQDLVMTISVNSNSKDINFEKLSEKPTIYALTLDSNVYNFDKHILNELRFLALAFPLKSGVNEISKIWPIKSVSLNSSTKNSNSHEKSLSYCYKFKLGAPLILNSPISEIPNININDSIRFITLSELESIVKFSEILSVY